MWQPTFESDFIEREEFHAVFGWLVEHRSTRCVILSQKAAVLVLLSSSTAAVLKAFTPLPYGKVI